MKVAVFCHLLHEGKILEIDRNPELADGSTLLDVVEHLERAGDLPAQAAAEFRRGRRSFSLLVNGRRHGWKESKEKRLSDGDEVSIVNPFAGG